MSKLPPGPPWSLLLVDDEPLILEMVSSRLRAEKYEVTTATNGEEAEQILGTRSFHAVICDVVMPKLDGLTLCRRTREHRNGVPFLFLTAKGQPQDIVELLTTGADDYLVKPFEPGELSARLKALFRRAYPAA